MQSPLLVIEYLFIPFHPPLSYSSPPSIPHKHNSNVLIINSLNCITVNVCRCRYIDLLYIYMHFNLNIFCCTIDFPYFFPLLIHSVYDLFIFLMSFTCLPYTVSHWNEQLDCIQLLTTTAKLQWSPHVSSCDSIWGNLCNTSQEMKFCRHRDFIHLM